jgi:hypothetical protein
VEAAGGRHADHPRHLGGGPQPWRRQARNMGARDPRAQARVHRAAHESPQRRLQAGVDETLLREAILRGARGSQALPFRFISAARAAPSLERTLGDALDLAAQDYEKLPGRTCLVIDVSGSMRGSLGHRTKLNRIDAAGALAVTTASASVSSTCYVYSLAATRTAKSPRSWSSYSTRSKSTSAARFTRCRTRWSASWYALSGTVTWCASTRSATR